MANTFQEYMTQFRGLAHRKNKTVKIWINEAQGRTADDSSPNKNAQSCIKDWVTCTGDQHLPACDGFGQEVEFEVALRHLLLEEGEGRHTLLASQALQYQQQPHVHYFEVLPCRKRENRPLEALPTFCTLLSRKECHKCYVTT